MPKVSAVPACCQCRARKLACSRTKPSCLSCQKRKEECLYPLVPGGFKKTPEGSFVLIDLNDPSELKYDIWEKNMRLKKLEESGVSVDPNSFRFTRNIKKDFTQLTSGPWNDHATIGANNDGSASNYTPDLDHQHHITASSFNQSGSLSRWKRRKINDSDGINDGISGGVGGYGSDVYGSEVLPMTASEIMKMTLPELQDCTLKLISSMKSMEEKLVLLKESSSVTNIDSVPVFNDLYDILFNSDYSNLVDLGDESEIIKKQVIKLKERLDFLENELKHKKTTENLEEEHVLCSRNVVPSHISDNSAESDEKHEEKDTVIENLDDALFRDSVPFMLWKKNKPHSSALYSLKALFAVSPELQDLQRSLKKEAFAVSSPEHVAISSSAAGEDVNLFSNNSVLNLLKMVPFDQCILLLDYFKNNFIAESIFPQNLFKLFESNSYKKNLAILRDLNTAKDVLKHAETNSVDTKTENAEPKRKPRGRPPLSAKNNASVTSSGTSSAHPTSEIKEHANGAAYIDVSGTRNSENLLLLEYNFAVLLSLHLINNTNASKTRLTNAHLSMLKAFEEVYISSLESNVKLFYNWCLMFDRTKNLEKLKIISQLLPYVKNPLSYKWDLINVDDKLLMEFQINIIKSKEQFLGLKSVIRLFDYDNRLLKQLANNINLTNLKIDYVLKELLKQSAVGKFEGEEQFARNIIAESASKNAIFKNIDLLLVYLNYNLCWNYYKAINVISTTATGSRSSRKNGFSKQKHLLSVARSNENERVFIDLFRVLLFTLTNVLEITSNNAIEQQLSLLNDKINHILIVLATVLYSIHHLNPVLLKDILQNLHRFVILNMNDLSVNYKSEHYSSFLDLLHFYITHIELTGMTSIDDSSEQKAEKENNDAEILAEDETTTLSFENLIHDFNDVLKASITITDPNTANTLVFGARDTLIENPTLSESQLRNLNVLFD